MDLQCKFSYIFHIVADIKVYSCDVRSKATRNDGRAVKSVEGQHVEGSSNQDVDVICFPDGSCQGFPLNLPAFFPKLISLTITNCKIKELSRQDLVGLQQLQCLSIYEASITSLPNDLFADMPNLRIIKFYHNKIEKLSPLLLDFLNWSILKEVDFRENVGIDEIFIRGENYVLTIKAGESFKRECHSTISAFRDAIEKSCTYDETNSDKQSISNENSDFLILVDGVEVKVHKKVLAQHSSVFLAMFSHDLEENRTNQMTITNYSIEAVQDMVQYIYEGKISNSGNIVELYAISTQYLVAGLQQLCQETIIDNIDESNMIEVLRIGCMFSSHRMKRAAFEKISEAFPSQSLDAKLMDRPDKLQKLIQLKRQFDADFDSIMKE